MKQVNSADFRKKYASLAEAVQVTAHGKEIGRWYPAGVELPQPGDNPTIEEPEIEASPARMTIRPVKDNHRPPLVAGDKRVIDPFQARHPQREVYDQLRAKMNQSEGSRQR